MSKPILYSTHCPKCNVLEKKMDKKHIEYEVVDDVNVMRSKGFLEAPQLEIDEKVYDFNQARNLVDEFDEEIGTFESFMKFRDAE